MRPTAVEIPECMKHLPTYRGLPVPYVVIWTSERFGPQLDWSPTGIKVRARPEYLRLNRGVWWVDTPDRRGQGEPDFGGTHSNRQRQCMSDPRCQVCGRRMKADKLLWIVPDAPDAELLHDDHDLHINPPTCADCFKGALQLCPHLLRFGHNVRVFKGTPRIAGVHATLVKPRNRTEIVYLKFTPENADLMPFLMGRQYLVTLDNEVEERRGDAWG